MGSNYKESGDTIVAEKDGNDNWVLYNQTLHSASDPWLKIDDDTGAVTWMNPKLQQNLDANGHSINNVYSPGVLVWNSGNLVHLDVNDYSDIGACLNDARTQYGLDDNVFKIVPGTYDLTTSVDYTHIDGGVTHKLDLYGTTIRVKTGSGTNGFEFVGTDRSHIAITGGRLYGSQSTPPDTGFILARTTNASYDDNAFLSLQNVNIEGYWAEAPIADIASEAIEYSGCDFNNDNNAGYAAIFTQTNIRSLTTQYADGINDGQSFSTHDFERCGFRSKTSAGNAVILADAMFIWNFETCYFMSFPGGEPVFDMRFQGGNLSSNAHEMIAFNNCMNDPGGTQGTTFQLNNESGSGGYIKEMSIRGGMFSPDSTKHLINDVGTDNANLYESDIGFSHPFTDRQGSQGIKLQGGLGGSKLRGVCFNRSLEVGGSLNNSILEDIDRSQITGTIQDNNFFIGDGGPVQLKTDTSDLLNLTDKSSVGWTDLDITTAGSGYVPDGAKGVILNMLINSGSAGCSLRIRKNGHTESAQVLNTRAFVAGEWIERAGTVQMDSNGMIEYRINDAPTNDTDVILRLVGWVS